MDENVLLELVKPGFVQIGMCLTKGLKKGREA